MDILERIRQILAAVLENLRGMRDIHLEGRAGTEVWQAFGSQSLAPGTSATVLTVTNPRGYAMATHDLGVTADPPVWGAGVGITYTLQRNDSAFPHLGAIEFPWGTVADRKRLKLSFATGESFKVVATNGSVTDTVEVCAAATGMFYSATRGIGSDKVK